MPIQVTEWALDLYMYICAYVLGCNVTKFGENVCLKIAVCNCMTCFACKVKSVVLFTLYYVIERMTSQSMHLGRRVSYVHYLPP